MLPSREIVSLQIGHYSNYVGSHLWNLQEDSFSYSGGPSATDHDVLYREGCSPKGEVTFTPRVILVDLKGSLKHLSHEGELYNDDISIPNLVNDISWPNEKIKVESKAPVTKNEYLQSLDMDADPGIKSKDYNLEETTEVWADFLKARYHPRSVLITNQFEHLSEAKPFDTFGYGVEVWQNKTFQEDFVDRTRNYMEECDNAQVKLIKHGARGCCVHKDHIANARFLPVQGFHITMDMGNGFSGLGCAVVEYLSDEYHKYTLVLPVLPPQVSEEIEPLQECIKTINTLVTFSHLAEHSSLIIPMGTDSLSWRSVGPPRSFPHISYNSRLQYHTSAIIAAALDTITLRYRLRANPCRLSDLVDPMSLLGRRVASASVALPLPIRPDSYLLDTLESWYGPLWTSLTPRCKADPDCIEDKIWMQSVVIRGVTNSQLKRLDVDPKARENPVYACKSPHEMLQLFLAFLSHRVASHVVSTEECLKLGTSFPNIFTPDITPDGEFDVAYKRTSDIRVRQCPAVSAVHSSGSVGEMLSSLITETANYRIGRFSNFAITGFDTEEFRECREKLSDLAECYKEDFDL